MRKVWSDEAWEDYLYWQHQDKKTLKKINSILKDIDRNGYGCEGHPESSVEIWQAFTVYISTKRIV